MCVCVCLYADVCMCVCMYVKNPDIMQLFFGGPFGGYDKHANTMRVTQNLDTALHLVALKR